VIRVGSLQSGVACVYEIRNTITNRVYIGSTARFAVRFTEHKRMLDDGDHHSRKLQHSYDKHGAIALEVVNVWESLTMAATIIPKATLAGVSECALGKRKHHAGFVWEFVKN